MPFRSALRTAAEIGAQAVEINARREIRPEDLSRTGIRHLRKMLADLNLQVCSLMFPTENGLGEPSQLDRRVDALKATLSAAQPLGTSVVVAELGSVDFASDSPNAKVLQQVLLEIGRHGNRVGAWLAVRTGMHSGETLHHLLGLLPSGTIGIDFDPGSLLMHGHSPEDSLRKVAPHVLSFRAFDAVRDGTGQAKHVQLGRGSVDFAMLFGLLEEHHYRGYIVVERRTDEHAGLSCQQTIEYLKSFF